MSRPPSDFGTLKVVKKMGILAARAAFKRRQTAVTMASMLLPCL